MTTAVVPLGGGSGKTRLAARFDVGQRADLVGMLARHVVRTVLAAGPVRDVLVVTGDSSFAARVLPVDRRMTVVAEPEDAPGLNSAVSLGRRLAIAQGADRVLVVHTDLPLLTTADVRALLTPGAQLVLAPDGLGRGTNALVLDASVHGFAFRFGAGSRAAHDSEAAALGLRTAVVRRQGTATDLDTPADWAVLPPAVRERFALSSTTDCGGPPPPAAFVAGSRPNLSAGRPAPGDRP